MSYKIIRKASLYIVRFYRNGKQVPELEAVWTNEKAADNWGKLIANA